MALGCCVGSLILSLKRKNGCLKSQVPKRRILFTRVLTDSGDPHYTYSLQVEVPDTAEYRRFMQDVMGEYSAIAAPLFGEQALHFTSLLKKIDI